MRLCFLILALIIGCHPDASAQSNDNFAGRLSLTGAQTTAVSNNFAATRELGEPNHAANAAGRSLWWTWTAPASGVVNFSTFPGSAGVTPPRTLAVYTGSTVSALTEVGSSNVLYLPNYQQTVTQSTTLAATGASLNLAVTAGTTYQIAVDAAASFLGADDGTVVLSINTPPTIVSAAGINAAAGAAFQYQILASSVPTAFGANNLPLGLALNPVSGIITGTLPGNGTYAIGLSATGPGGTGTATLTLQVGDPMPVAPTAPIITQRAGLSGYVGVSISFFVAATGSPTGYSASNLPDGLTINATSGLVSGTPTTAGTFSVPVSASNAVGTSNAVLTLTIIAAVPPPVITSALAFTVSTGGSYTYHIATAGDSTAATPTAYAATGLPPGFTVNSTGYISGTSTQAGVYPVAMSATNPSGTRTATLTITVSDAAPAPAPTAPWLTSAAASSAAVGTAYSYTLTAASTPTGFTASNLPPGLAFNSATGAISGTPTAAGTFAIPVSAVNSYGTSTGTLTITVFASAAAQAGARGVVSPVITSAASVAGHAGESLTYTVSSIYGSLPYLVTGNGTPSSAYTWTFSASGLPPGLGLSSATSYNYGTTTITGTPTAAGIYRASITASVPANTFYPDTRSASSTTAIVTFIILPGPASVPTFGFTAGQSVQATTIDYNSTSTKATNSPTSYSTSGFPPGVGVNTVNGNIYGTPTVAGFYPAMLSGTNAAGTGTAQVNFVVAPPPAPYIISAAAAYGTASSSFSYTISSTLNPPASYTASGLPSGLSCNPTSGKITGTPTAAGVYPATISATDTSGNVASATLMITIASNAPAIPILSNACTAQGTVGSSFVFGLYSSPYALSFDANSLPPGLSLAPSNGQITGTPTTTGAYTVPISATNSAGTGTATLTIIIAPAQLPVFTSSAVINAVVGTALNYATAAINGPTSYGASNLPPGVTINPSSGLISGTPTNAGTYPVSLTATNAVGSSSATLTISVTSSAPAGATLSSSITLMQLAQVGVFASTSFYAPGSLNSLAASGLPPGLTVNTSSGYISGTPTTAGSYPVTISATDANGAKSAMVTYVVTNPVPAFTSLADAASAVVNASFSATLKATNNPTSYAASGLPPGLTLNPTTGLVSGTPTAVGVYAVNVSATNSAGAGSAVWTVSVGTTASVVPVFTYSFAGAIGIVGGYLSDSANASADVLPLTYTFSGGPPGTVGTVGSGYVYFSGVLTTPGTYTGTITATTQYGGSSTIQVKYVIAPALPPAVSSAASVPGNVGSALTYKVTSASSVTGYTASNLPPGLVFNAATGVITGTPTAAGTYPVNVAVTSATGTGSAVVTFVIAGLVGDGLPIINSAAQASCQDILVPNSPFGGNETTAFSYTITALNAPTSFGAANLPAGMSLNPFTGVISGQPLVGGIFLVPITATNATGSSNATLTIIATTTAPSISNALTIVGSVGTPIAASLVTNTNLSLYYRAYGGIYDPLTLTALALPPGLSLNTSTGSIDGVPTQAGTYPVTVTTTNRVGTGSAVVTFVIASPAPATASAPSFYGVAMVEAYVGSSLSAALAATGATSYAVGASLPAGLSLDPATGKVTGAPTQAGIFSVPVSATNATGTSQAALTFAVDAVPPTPIINSVAAASAATGTPFIYAITTATSALGSAPITAYGASGLPAGLSLNQTTGFITGTPVGPTGTFQIPISASAGATVGAGTLTLTVLPARASQPVLSNTAGALGLLDNPLTYSLGSSGFAPTNTLPAGLGFDAGNGSISGYASSTGLSQIGVAAPGAGNTGGGAAIVTLGILAPDLSLPRLTQQPLGSTVLQNSSVNLVAAAVGIPLPTYQWTLNGVPVSGATAATLSLSQVQPADAGTYILTATNAAGTSVSAPAVLVVQQTFATWQAANFTPGEIAAGMAADAYDFSGDGIPNLLKYALDMDPITGTGGSSPMGSYIAADSALQLSFRRDAAHADIDYVVESSSDLSQWAPIARSASGSSTVNLGGASMIMESTVPGTNQIDVVVESEPPVGASKRQFLRLEVVKPSN